MAMKSEAHLTGAENPVNPVQGVYKVAHVPHYIMLILAKEENGY